MHYTNKEDIGQSSSEAQGSCRSSHKTGSQKRKREGFAFRRQINEKPSVMPGCPGKQDLTFSMAEHWTSGTARSLPARPRENRAAADCRKKASALLHLIWSISMPKPEATPGLIKACSSGLHTQPHRMQVRHQKAG